MALGIGVLNGSYLGIVLTVPDYPRSTARDFGFETLVRHAEAKHRAVPVTRLNILLSQIPHTGKTADGPSPERQRRHVLTGAAPAVLQT
jgi:hypothetical protein